MQLTSWPSGDVSKVRIQTSFWSLRISLWFPSDFQGKHTPSQLDNPQLKPCFGFSHQFRWYRSKSLALDKVGCLFAAKHPVLLLQYDSYQAVKMCGLKLLSLILPANKPALPCLEGPPVPLKICCPTLGGHDP